MRGVYLKVFFFVLSRCLRKMDPFPSQAFSYFSSCCHIHVTVGITRVGCSVPPLETITLQRKVRYPRFKHAVIIQSTVWTNMDVVHELQVSLTVPSPGVLKPRQTADVLKRAFVKVLNYQQIHFFSFY